MASSYTDKIIANKCSPAFELDGHSVVFLHCILNEKVVPFSNFRALAVKLRVVHISMPGSEHVWRAFLLDEDDTFKKTGTG